MTTHNPTQEEREAAAEAAEYARYVADCEEEGSFSIPVTFETWREFGADGIDW